MGIEINNANAGRPDSLRKDSGKLAPPDATNAAPAESKADKSTADSVSLSNRAKGLTQLESEIKNLPDVDQSKVDALKAKIESGEYQVNPGNMAQKMLDMESWYFILSKGP